MRLVLIAAFFTLALGGCQSVPRSQPQLGHGDGSTAELAVDLSGAHDEFEGMQAQRAWLSQNYPGAEVKSQSLLMGPRVMDLITISLPSGEERNIYFDISSYFGKM